MHTKRCRKKEVQMLHNIHYINVTGVSFNEKSCQNITTFCTVDYYKC